MRKCPVCRMYLEDRNALYCLYCRRLMQEAQAELGEWVEGGG